MSFSTVIMPILAALSGAQNYINKPGEWKPINGMQQLLVQKYVPRMPELTYLSDKEIRTWASRDINYLNDILRKEGFSIQLNPCSLFGVVSILDILVKWKTPGKESTVYAQDVAYPAVSMVKKDGQYSILNSDEYQNPIIKLDTQNNDVVYITVADEPSEQFELAQKIERIMASNLTENFKYDAIRFPMIDFNARTDITWLSGMEFCGISINEALQQTTFKMDAQGAHARSAVAIAAKAIRSNMLTIDKPFFVWIMRPHVKTPLFVGYMTYDNWKNPAGL